MNKVVLSFFIIIIITREKLFLTITIYKIKLERKQNWRAWKAAQSDLEFYLDKKVCDKCSTDTQKPKNLQPLNIKPMKHLKLHLYKALGFTNEKWQLKRLCRV